MQGENIHLSDCDRLIVAFIHLVEEKKGSINTLLKTTRRYFIILLLIIIMMFSLMLYVDL